MKNFKETIESTIEDLQTQFTTHELIISLAKNNQHQYIAMLNEHLGSKRPFQTLHSKVGKYLSLETESVNKVEGEEKADVDIFRQPSSSPLWTKRIEG